MNTIQMVNVLNWGSEKNPLIQCDNLNLKFNLNNTSYNTHRTKYQESINRNVVEICETIAETRWLTHVSAGDLVTFTHVSIAAVTAEPYHFFTYFRQVSVEGNKRFRKRNFMLTCAETPGNVPEMWIFYISVDVIRLKRSWKYKVMFRKHIFFSCFHWRNQTKCQQKY